MVAAISYLASAHAGGDHCAAQQSLRWDGDLGPAAGHPHTVRNAGQGEDKRYTAILGKQTGSLVGYVARTIYAPQAVILFVVSLPVQLAMYEAAPLGLLGVLGIVVWVHRVLLRSGGRRTAGPLHQGSGQRREGHGPGAVGVDPASELLRRRLRVVRPVAAGAGPPGRSAHRRLTGRDDLLPGQCHRKALLERECAAARGAAYRTTSTNQRFLSPSTETVTAYLGRRDGIACNDRRSSPSSPVNDAGGGSANSLTAWSTSRPAAVKDTLLLRRFSGSISRTTSPRDSGR